MNLYVVVVEPKYAGNTGSIARIIKNFGFQHMILVNPAFSLDDDECRKFAVHAQDILDNATILSHFDEAAVKMDYMVGTTSIESRNDKHHLRKAFLAKDVATDIYKISGNIGIAFGREDYGLLNEEIKNCDILVKIPTSDVYPSLNLSHAVCIVLYELFVSRHEPKELILADGKEKLKLYDFFDRLLNSTSYPEFKKESTNILFRRIIGRAMLSKWEYHTLMGVFKKSIEAGKQQKE